MYYFSGYWTFSSELNVVLSHGYRYTLKEKLPQAFMQIEWMEKNFRNLTAKVWENVDNPIELWFFKVLVNFLYAALSGGTVLIPVMSQQYNCLMELYTNFTKFSLFMKMHLPSTLILRYVRAKMIVHAFMIELDQLDYWYPRKKKRKKNWNSMYKVNGELFSCEILA